jgi:hypothetical protein
MGGRWVETGEEESPQIGLTNSSYSKTNPSSTREFLIAGFTLFVA